jgi:hypothetical protein
VRSGLHAQSTTDSALRQLIFSPAIEVAPAGRSADRSFGAAQNLSHTCALQRIIGATNNPIVLGNLDASNA